MKCVAWISGLLIAAAICGCKTKSHPQIEYMPDMYRQPSVRAQEYDPNAPGGVGMRLPVDGTVARGQEPYPYGINDTTESNKFLNPLTGDTAVVERGKKYYNTYCIVCHGPKGGGDGLIVPKFTPVPALTSDKVRKWPDGRIYHTMTLGQGLMSNYASQVLPEQRWEIIHYIRSLQQDTLDTEPTAGKTMPRTTKK